jgi:hypothetical protein
MSTLELRKRKQFLKESVQHNLAHNLRSLYLDSKDILSDFDKTWNLNLKLLSTWGAALGGVMLPMKNWIEQKYPELSYEQVILVLMGSIISFFYDNEYFISAIVKKIKKEGLMEEFKQSTIVSQKLINSLTSLLNEMNYFGNDNVDYLSFAYVLPILEDLKKGISIDNLDAVSNRIYSSGVVLTNKSNIKFFLRKLIELS